MDVLPNGNVYVTFTDGERVLAGKVKLPNYEDLLKRLDKLEKARLNVELRDANGNTVDSNSYGPGDTLILHTGNRSKGE